MYPFHALPEPALPDDHRYYYDFGGLPADTLPLVVRSIAPDERTSLLNLALVNKTAYFATREPRQRWTMLAEAGATTWEPTALGEARRFEHALHMVCDPQSTLSSAEKHALLCHWLKRFRAMDVCQEQEKHSSRNMERRRELRAMHRTLEAACVLPQPEQSDLLWKLLVAHQHLVYTQVDGFLKALKQKEHVLSEGEREAYVLACQIADWHGMAETIIDQNLTSPQNLELDVKERTERYRNLPSYESLKGACTKALSQADVWPIPALAQALETILMYIGASRAVALLNDISGEISREFAIWPDERRSLFRSEMATRLRQKYWDKVLGNCTWRGIEAPAKLPVQQSRQREISSWVTKILASCAQNKCKQPLSYEETYEFWLHNGRDGTQLAGIKEAIASAQETGDKASGFADKIATWRIVIDVVENYASHSTPATLRDENALRNANALLAGPGVMTPAAWFELMGRTLCQFRDKETRHSVMLDALRYAEKLADESPIVLLLHIVHALDRAAPAYQSAILKLMLPMAKQLGDRAKADLFQALLHWHLNNSSQGSEAEQCLLDSTCLLAELPQPLRMRAIERALRLGLHQDQKETVYALLLSELRRAAATLPPQPHASLLLCLARCIGRLPDKLGDSAFAALLEQADGLNLPQEMKSAWVLLYRAAFLNNDQGNTAKEKILDIKRDIQGMPEALREKMMRILEDIAVSMAWEHFL